MTVDIMLRYSIVGRRVTGGEVAGAGEVGDAGGGLFHQTPAVSDVHQTARNSRR